MKNKYDNGSKGIKTKSGMSNFINGESDKVKNMSDEDLRSSVMRNMNFQTTKQNAKEEELLDETVNRKWKKQGGYEDGTKGIKTKSQISSDATSVRAARAPIGLPKAVAKKEYANAFDDYQSNSRSAASTAKSDSLDQDFSNSYGNNAQYDRDFPGNKYSTGKSKLTKDSPSRVEADKIEKSRYAMGTKGIKTKKMY